MVFRAIKKTHAIAGFTKPGSAIVSHTCGGDYLCAVLLDHINARFCCKYRTARARLNFAHKKCEVYMFLHKMAVWPSSLYSGGIKSSSEVMSCVKCTIPVINNDTPSFPLLLTDHVLAVLFYKRCWNWLKFFSFQDSLKWSPTYTITAWKRKLWQNVLPMSSYCKTSITI